MLRKCCTLLLCLFITPLHADPLPSWFEGATKKKILDFVKVVAQEGSPHYVAPKDRIAVFDEDGTTWVEQPLYVQFIYAFDQVKELVPKHPEWNDIEPFKSILTHGYEALQNFNSRDIEKIVVATHSGMSIENFQDQVNVWLKKAMHPRFKRPFTELVYQPMLEVIQYLRENQFQIYIVSGGGQQFIRAFADRVYGIPLQNVIGTAGKIKFEYNNGEPHLIKLPDVLFINDKEGKPEGINLIIGKRPIIAFGNSIGDREMLEWTQGGKGKTLELLVHHDDATREYAYGPDSKIGTFSDSLMQEAKQKDWIVISMKNDWKVIFSWETSENAPPIEELQNVH